MDIIDGKTYAEMLENGYRDLKSHYEEINDLNVFPVPDGDTGTNIAATLEGGMRGVKKANKRSIGDVALKFSSEALLTARGNSGVITSQFFAGISDSLKGLKKANVKQFANALKNGARTAYKAVITPTEGTILTVAREGSEYVVDHINEIKDFETLFEVLLKKMRESLDHTPDLLPVLKEAGVIDSGGAGLLCIIEGMGKQINGELIEDSMFKGPVSAIDADARETFTEDSKMDYAYCTEFIMQLLKEKGDPNDFSLEKLNEFLLSIGDSLVSIQNGTIVKCHIHTFEPWKAIKYAQQYGEFVTFKMENMTIQHNAKGEHEHKDVFGQKFSENIEVFDGKDLDIAIVAVSPSHEFSEIFNKLGVRAIVKGGQTMNPSPEDFIEAFNCLKAKDIIVLPNNGNVVLSAKQAAANYDKANIHVFPSKTLVNGYAALGMIDLEGMSVEENLAAMEEASSATTAIEISKAIRDSKNNGVSIKKGELISIMGGKINASSRTLSRLLEKTFKEIPDMDEKSLLTVFYGKDATEKGKADFKKAINKINPMLEIIELDGGQGVYPYIMSLE